VCKFSLAVNRRPQERRPWVEESELLRHLSSGGVSGEAINQYLVKGNQNAVEGELRQDRWEQDGQNRSKCRKSWRTNVATARGRRRQRRGRERQRWAFLLQRSLPAGTPKRKKRGAGTRPEWRRDSGDVRSFCR
jgi:single-stranded DNA-binding protein